MRFDGFCAFLIENCICSVRSVKEVLICERFFNYNLIQFYCNDITCSNKTTIRGVREKNHSYQFNMQDRRPLNPGFGQRMNASLCRP